MRESVDYYCVTNLHKDTNPELTGCCNTTQILRLCCIIDSRQLSIVAKTVM
jgi:RNase adaptor protein for sRNA GlmZ degradation